ncbi:hypothetical protein BaRGS_00030907 [Batillaria attramentaria]|uniref:Secreted protein n=1 Tax=Batillaria attramentaria TaxID=370345 RepID=A0ABD0JS57_9CAEN
MVKTLSLKHANTFPSVRQLLILVLRSARAWQLVGDLGRAQQVLPVKVSLTVNCRCRCMSIIDCVHVKCKRLSKSDTRVVGRRHVDVTAAQLGANTEQSLLGEDFPGSMGFVHLLLFETICNSLLCRRTLLHGLTSRPEENRLR